MSATSWLRTLVYVTLAAMLLVVPAHAQDEEDENAWELDPFARIELGTVFSQSEDRDDELIINGDGGYLRAQAGVTFGNEKSEFRFEADRIEVQRFGSATGRDAYNRDRLTAQFSQAVGDDWEVQLRGRLYDDLVTVESPDTDEKQGSVRIEYEPERAHRFRLSGTWRDREYDDSEGPGGTSSTGEGPRVDFEYRHRLGRYNYINFDLRAEEINSDNPDRSYTRESVGASYTQPITRDLRVRPAVELRHTRFDGRLTPGGEAREDTQFVPEVELLWWTGNWRMEAEAKYIFSDSNDPVRDRQGYRFSLSVGYVF
ncbi:hypothetical protein [Aurantiacibacter sp. D1-12]|uniref:hypothetical protein n=1 Tax=Aurantiacibacter sp. D1-12 TaxID=2993658 RepID=UPI00237C91CB|nr:hypothetical protein [Aurantiacibacter sp. D1-12]MDE1467384.1 hypothetical protein [Aurantiacibacter sp. D1-12]